MDGSSKALIVLLAAAGVGAGYYFLVYKPMKQAEQDEQAKGLPAGGPGALPPQVPEARKGAQVPSEPQGRAAAPSVEDEFDPDCNTGNVLIDTKCKLAKKQAREQAARAEQIRMLTQMRMGGAYLRPATTSTGPSTGRPV